MNGKYRKSVVGMVFMMLVWLVPAAHAQLASSFAATYATAYQDDYAAAIRQADDQNYLAAGWTETQTAGSADAWLLKFAQDGKIFWQKKIGGTKDDYASDLLRITATTYMVAGGTASFGAGGSDAWLLKLDANTGNILWQKAYGGARDDYAESIQPTANGGCLVAGWTESFGSGNRDMWVFEVDQAGNILWQKTYGGANLDMAVAIRRTTDGGAIVLAESNSFGAGNSDFWVLKLNSTGGIVWQKTYSVPYLQWEQTFDGIEHPQAIEQTQDGGYIAIGETRSTFDFPYADENIWILKLTANGGVSWQRAYSRPLATNYGAAIRQTTDGGFLLGGWDNGLLVAKLDQTGTMLWQQAYDQSVSNVFWHISSLQATADGGTIAGGFIARGSGIISSTLALKLDQNDSGKCLLKQPPSFQSVSTPVSSSATNIIPASASALVTTTTASTTTTVAAPSYLCAPVIVCEAGDMNCDGLFNIFDLQRLINCIFSKGSCANGDLNGDGQYNIFDVQRLVNKIFNRNSLTLTIHFQRATDGE